MLAGNRVARSSEPLAMAYASHQFGAFVPQLGDGRAILLGEAVNADGVRRDVQLKGSCPTPFSRNGDGRGALGPVLREYIYGELTVGFLNGPTYRWVLSTKDDKPGIRRVLDEATDFARKHEASHGQLLALRKALTDAGYHLTK